MSYFPVWWDTTITIYNKFEDSTTRIVKWYRHTVDKCFWKNESSKISIGETVLSTDYTICRIPKDPKFKEKYLWIAVPNDEKGDYFTLGVGDIIVKGAVEDEIDEYTQGKRSSEIINKYKDLQGCIEINQVSIDTGKGRNNEHYFVKGI